MNEGRGWMRDGGGGGVNEGRGVAYFFFFYGGVWGVAWGVL